LFGDAGFYSIEDRDTARASDLKYEELRFGKFLKEGIRNG